MEARNEKRNELSQSKKLAIFKTLFENAAFSGFEMTAQRGDKKQITELALNIGHVDLDDVIEITKAIGCSFHIHGVELDDNFSQVFKLTIN